MSELHLRSRKYLRKRVRRTRRPPSSSSSEHAPRPSDHLRRKTRSESRQPSSSSSPVRADKTSSDNLEYGSNGNVSLDQEDIGDDIDRVDNDSLPSNEDHEQLHLAVPVPGGSCSEREEDSEDDAQGMPEEANVVAAVTGHGGTGDVEQELNSAFSDVSDTAASRDLNSSLERDIAREEQYESTTDEEIQGDSQENSAEAGKRAERNASRKITSIQDLENRFEMIRLYHRVSKAGSKAYYELMTGNVEQIVKAEEEGHTFPSYKTVQRRVQGNCPDVKLTTAHLNVDTNDTELLTNLEKYPRKKYSDKAKWKVRKIITHVSLSDVINFHKATHDKDNDCSVLDCSLDGVPESKQSRKSLLVLCVRFVGKCSKVYPVTIAEAGEDYKDLESEILDELIKEINLLGIRLRLVLADAPMRAKIKNVISHAGYYGCDLCLAKGSHHRRAGHYYPASSTRASPRTFTDCQRIMRDMDTLGVKNMTEDQKQGYKGKSVLLNLNGHFDIILGVRPEYMHLLPLGIIRQLFRLSFDVGKKPFGRVLQTRRVKSSVLTPSLISAKGLTEWERRPRPVEGKNYKDYKATEWSNLVVAFGPIVIYSVPPGPERIVWIHLIYLVRWLVLPEEELARCTQNIDVLALKFLKLIEEYFGTFCLGYNMHLLSHISQLRIQGRSSYLDSCFTFESLYAQLLSSICAGTTSTSKQALLAAYTKYQLEHDCTPDLFFSEKETAKTCDKYCYTFQADTNTVKVYEICQAVEDKLIVKSIALGNLQFGNIRLEEVGIFRFYELLHEVTEISAKDVSGKCIKSQNCIVTVPKLLLQ